MIGIITDAHACNLQPIQKGGKRGIGKGGGGKWKESPTGFDGK